MFLSDEDLRILTGYARSRKQIEWLTRHSIPFRVNALGRPVVMKDALTSKPQATFRMGVVT